MTRREAYRELGLAETATQDEVRTAYLGLAKRWHPDRHQSDGDGSRRAADVVFARITEAYRAIASASFDPDPDQPPKPDPAATWIRPEPTGTDRNPPGATGPWQQRGWPPPPPPPPPPRSANTTRIRPARRDDGRDGRHGRSLAERIVDAPADLTDWLIDRILD